jgi:hypothetical protein
MDSASITNMIMQQMLIWGGISILVTVVMIFVIMRVVRKAINPHGNMANALPGQATILNLWETGMYVNQNPQVGFHLNVQHPDGSTYEAQTKTVVSIVQLPRLQPGATVSVKIDAQDRAKVALA